MPTDVETVSTETPEQQLQAAEDADVKNEAELMKDVDGVLDKTNQADSAGDGKGAPGEVKETAEATDPKDLDDSALAHAQSIGMDRATAERFHKAGLLEEALVTADRRLLTGSVGGQANPGQPQQQQPDGTAGQNTAPEGMPPPLSADEYPEELVARDQFMQSTIAAQQQQLQQFSDQLEQVSGFAQEFQSQRDREVGQWFDKQLGEVGNEELFGKGPLASLPADSPQRANRMQAFRAYSQLTGAPQGMDATGVQRAVRALFHNELQRADQQKVQDKLRDAAGQFVSPSKGGKAPDPPPAKTEEEADANLMADVDKVLAKHGK